ncbi:MAG: hypothetical protein AVDCRST_MAG64-389 [uncultured Phycisphaerae bacterium]|uniref:histidine kinase n=1 Tax=uncultured Phycisphaerae bacterium TaxID=904963 RepID=A0A6J4N4W9_9BACT|nr:MAG: hypothetical protein AVDCRST_MAG64-389 [uncultured Phycisphaerae bacterium]
MTEHLPRIPALQRTGLLDSPPEECFDRLTRLAAKVLRTRVALVSLVDADRQFFKSCVGLPEPWASLRETPLSHSFCRHVADSGEPLVVPDARECPLVRDNPAVADLGVIAYAGVPLATPGGDVLGSFCVIDTEPRQWSADDLDILKELAASVMTEVGLKQAKDAAESANRVKDRFLATLSHELRTPISPALMIATSMAADEALPPQVRADARTIQRNVELQTRLIDDLLDVTRIENGKLALHPEEVDLHGLLTDCVAICAAEAGARRVRVDYRPPERPHAVRGDPARLRQVFCNLLKNATKFTPPGGEVTVAASGAGERRVRVTVRDTGIGVEPGVLTTMFDPYEQGGRAITNEFSGLGLGLAISKGIVAAHGGTISAASDGKGRGTTLTVELPAEAATFAGTPPDARRQQSRPAEGVRQAAGLSILVVDDHQDTLNAMSRLLRRLDHRVTIADSKAAALTAADGEAFDLVISDIGLPDGSGLELMRELLARRPIKGIALTGYGLDSDVQATRSAGFDAHLTKPIKFGDVEEVIRQLTD